MTVEGTQRPGYRPMRHKANARAEIVSDAGIARVALKDISRDGAKIAPGMWLARGSAVTLNIDGEALPAIVHWAREDAAGIRFLDRPDPNTLIRLERSAEGPNPDEV